MGFAASRTRTGGCEEDASSRFAKGGEPGGAGGCARGVVDMVAEQRVVQILRVTSERPQLARVDAFGVNGYACQYHCLQKVEG